MTKPGYIIAVTLILICLVVATAAASLLEFELTRIFTVLAITIINITGLTAMLDDAQRIRERKEVK